MNFGALKARVEAFTGRSNPRIGDYINERQREVCRSHNFSFLQQTFPSITTAVGTQDYDLPAGFKDDLHVWYVDADGQKRALEQIDLVSGAEEYGTTANDRGEPEAWCMKASKLALWPIPDGVYTIEIEGFGYLANLVNEGDTNYLTDNWPDLLAEGAMARCWLEVQMTEEASLHEAVFQKLLRDLRVQDVERSLPGVMFIEPRTGSHR